MDGGVALGGAGRGRAVVCERILQLSDAHLTASAYMAQSISSRHRKGAHTHRTDHRPLGSHRRALAGSWTDTKMTGWLLGCRDMHLRTGRKLYYLQPAQRVSSSSDTSRLTAAFAVLPEGTDEVAGGGTVPLTHGKRHLLGPLRQQPFLRTPIGYKICPGGLA